MDPQRDTPQPTLHQVLQALGLASKRVRGSPEAHRLAHQILRTAAFAIDEAISSAPVVYEGGGSRDKFWVTLPEGQNAESHMTEVLAGHIAAARAAVCESFAKVPGISLCNDDSTVRSHELANTVLVLPSNAACWAPTQAVAAPEGGAVCRTARN